MNEFIWSPVRADESKLLGSLVPIHARPISTNLCAAGENPCGIWFTPDNGLQHYKEQNCGKGPIQLIGGAGHFYAECRRESWSCKMGDLVIAETWACTPW